MRPSTPAVTTKTNMTAKNKNFAYNCSMAYNPSLVPIENQYGLSTPQINSDGIQSFLSQRSTNEGWNFDLK